MSKPGDKVLLRILPSGRRLYLRTMAKDGSWKRLPINIPYWSNVVGRRVAQVEKEQTKSIEAKTGRKAESIVIE